MKIAVVCAPYGHHKPQAAALLSGIRAAGDEAVAVQAHTPLDGFDAVACWGWRIGRERRERYPKLPALIMERGYVGDRFHWTSLGWNGLNGRATFADAKKQALALDPYVRFHRNFGHTAPWNQLGYDRAGYALILGQVQSDQACRNVNLTYQYRAWYGALRTAGYEVRFRPHPKERRQISGLPKSAYTTGTLAEDLAGAQFTVSWNSNSSVDSVLAGVPGVTFDEGAMAWPVTSHDLRNPVTMPSRTEWAAQLAWCQWEPAELESGAAWRAVREVIP